MSSFTLSKEARVKTLMYYSLMVMATIALFFVIRQYGEKLQAPAPTSLQVKGPAAVTQTNESLVHVLLVLVAVILLARIVGAVFKYFHQPPVIGEILAGIMLGPSLLGQFSPGAYAYLLPPTIAPYLGIISQVGVLLYMFLVGLELNTRLIRKSPHATLAISHASIIFPFILGSLLAAGIYPILSTSDVNFTAFALFVGVSMSVTAFPVLARILTDRKIHRTQMGVTALACAAVDDVTAWCLLALVVGILGAKMGSVVLTITLTVVFIGLMLFVVRRPIKWLCNRLDKEEGRISQGMLAVILLGLLLSALATEYIGIHAIFGAFLFGVIIPFDSRIAHDLTDRLQDLVVVLLLPAFFAFTGMRTQIGLVDGLQNWMICIIIIAVASVGKFGGTLLAARMVGLNWREGSALGILMNTRGLMELIVLNIGLDLGVISPTLFAMLVIMALVTTFATTPILHLITRQWVGVAVPAGPAKRMNNPAA